MNIQCKALIAVLPTLLLAVTAMPASAGRSVEEAGAITCRVEKWDEKEIAKDHKRVAAATTCVLVPDDPAALKSTEACSGSYEYMPDGSWKGTGTCTDTYKGGDTATLDWEEGSHLKEYLYKKTGGTGTFKGVSGGGTYVLEPLTDTIYAGRYKGTLVFP